MNQSIARKQRARRRKNGEKSQRSSIKSSYPKTGEELHYAIYAYLKAEEIQARSCLKQAKRSSNYAYQKSSREIEKERSRRRW